MYVPSYPLRPGPTCGQGTGVTETPPWQNTDNPYDTDPTSRNDALHGVVQVLRVPLDNPEDTEELPELPLSYPGDPDGKQDWAEKGLSGGGLEPAAIACHDIAVHMEHNIAGAACAEQGQVWEIDPETGIADTENPMMVGDDEVSSGGTGQFPGAVDFFHSVMFNNDGTIVNWVDESFGTGCPTMTTYQPRAVEPRRRYPQDREDVLLRHGGELPERVPRGRPAARPGATEYCSAHMGMTVAGIKKDLLVNAWYTGGVDVINFTRPRRLREIAYYDPEQDSGTWSAYPYTGPLFQRGRGVPVYASDGVENNALAEGMVVYRARIQQPRRREPHGPHEPADDGPRDDGLNRRRPVSKADNR